YHSRRDFDAGKRTNFGRVWGVSHWPQVPYVGTRPQPPTCGQRRRATANEHDCPAHCAAVAGDIDALSDKVEERRLWLCRMMLSPLVPKGVVGEAIGPREQREAHCDAEESL